MNTVEALSAAVDARDLMMPAFRAIDEFPGDPRWDNVVRSRRVIKHIRRIRGETASFRFSNNNGG